MKKIIGLVVAVALATAARAAITIGSTDDPKASEIDFGNDTYCLVFSNGNAEAWTFTPSAPLRVEKLLVVGGGGSGGNNCGAGGGGGGVVYTNYDSLAAADRPVISNAVSVLVGAGGAPVSSAGAGKLGSPSEITIDGDAITAYGGGGGGAFTAVPTPAAAENQIGSGGGASYKGSGKRAVAGWGYNAAQGHPGGVGASDYGGGGGGADGDGGNADASTTSSGCGGEGFACSITGESHLYGSGGCGGNAPVVPDPPEGGGRGADKSIAPTAGTDGLGGGGGGSRIESSGAGGCGTVILVVTVLNDGKISATVDDVFAAYDGSEHRCSAVVSTKGVTVKWGTAESGPFDLDEAPGFTEIGVHPCWCQLTATGRETRVLKGTVYIRGDATSVDVAICTDSSAVQYSFGGDLYTLGFTNVSAGTVSVTPKKRFRIERILVVGGGGSGGCNCGGGGGGGGVVYCDYMASAEAARPVVTNAITLSVGAGGSAVASAGGGVLGTASELTIEGVTTTAYGGGGGGGYTAVPTPASVEEHIGSGGGGSWKGAGKLAVVGWGYNPKQGNMGGYGASDNGAGGGGAGASGGNATSSDGGRGGDGFACAITGESHLYGSGGGGGNAYTIPDPPEGGGRGAVKFGQASSGVNGLGGGGGGSCQYSSGGGGSGCIYLLVTEVESPEVSAVISDYYGSTDGESYSNPLTVSTAGAEVRWSLTGAEGPFDIVTQPSFNVPGVYTNWCRVTASGKDPKVLRGIVALRSASGDYFVTASGSDQTGLGTSDRPYASVAKAVSEVRLGNTVRVAAGTYLTRSAVLDRTVRLIGDGPDRASVILDAEKGGCVLVVSDEGACVSGLTIKNGYDASGGANVRMTAGAVTNCVLTGGLGTGSDNGGNAYIGGGLMIDCEIKSGSARRGGGATLAGSGRMVRCYIHGNSASDSGGGLSINGNAVVENSLVTGNYAMYGGGVQLDSSGAWLVNCTVAGNSGNYSGIWHEGGGGHVVNCVVYNGYYSKKGTTEHCALSSTPTQGGTATFANNVTLTADMFAETATYRPVLRTALHDGGDNAAYRAHAVSATDYGAGPRRQGRIDIGHYELPMRIGTLFSVR